MSRAGRAAVSGRFISSSSARKRACSASSRARMGLYMSGIAVMARSIEGVTGKQNFRRHAVLKQLDVHGMAALDVFKEIHIPFHGSARRLRGAVEALEQARIQRTGAAKVRCAGDARNVENGSR